MVRAMTDQIREALFSTLGPRVVGAGVLDLYAGSGSVGIEALSRGAAHSTFVERDPRAVDVIRSNLEDTNLVGRATLVPSDAEEFVSSSHAGVPFDLVFVDPPFNKGVPEALLDYLAAGSWMAHKALVVLRVSSRLKDITVPSALRVGWTRRYGDSTLVYIEREEEAQ